ncbi:hypothetical protein JMJ56_20960 [Belnapia sp. T18]|jgi:hypothetical protein|uniref:Uncharacterized protein n=2 Tax=Acetobacterales TaxID=3120395 RepID=A0A6J4ICN5_9PROT|nr:hypothetical protein [Belnapia arida]MBL6080490.1 hypothetical protein [Belnapia arida]CAA9246536.1 MAG: hypothetical protein AVDCRST_MAG27-1718 [uncultured Craurococcus sp.]
MRSFEGQFSDNRPLKRTREEKVRLLAELKETYKTLKPHTSPELRTSIAGKIRELQAELAAPPPPPRERRGPPQQEQFGTGPRPPRRPRPPREI